MTPAGLGRILELGALAEQDGCALSVPRLQAAMEAFPATADICAIFHLNPPEQASFAWCLARAANALPFPALNEMTALWRAFGYPFTEGISPLLRPDSGVLLRVACDLVFEQEPRLPDYIQLDPAPEHPVFHAERLLEECDAFLARILNERENLPAVLALSGPAGSGKGFLLAELARRRECALLTVDCGQPANPNEIAGIAALFGALVCLDHWDSGIMTLTEQLFSHFSVLLLSCASPPPVPHGCKSMLSREVPPLTYEERLRAVQTLFGSQYSEDEMRRAAFCGTSIGGMFHCAARLRAEKAAGIDLPPLQAALAQESTAMLEQCARRVTNIRRLRDLVLPAGQKRLLERICAFAKTGETVWREWGFAEVLPGSHGITALFYGASGTGKTMAASAVAGEVNLPLYRVDLAQIISKYVGETQKNIGRVFDAAADSDCILFFDEADALFSRRSESNDANDRHANAEIAYLLQRTEQHDGIILLATNLLQNFDEAFRRRIGFMIHFPAPDAPLREQLWRKALSARAPMEDIDFTILAQQLELTGASIRSCVLGAARIAAAEGGAITMSRIAEAARDEYGKLGKTFPELLAQRYPLERSRT